MKQVESIELRKFDNDIFAHPEPTFVVPHDFDFNQERFDITPYNNGTSNEFIDELPHFKFKFDDNLLFDSSEKFETIGNGTREFCFQSLKLEGFCMAEIKKESKMKPQKIFEVTKTKLSKSTTQGELTNNLINIKTECSSKSYYSKEFSLTTKSSCNRFGLEIKNLTVSILKVMISLGRPVSQVELKQDILPFFGTLRKSNGSTYNSNIDKSISSTLLSTKIFFKDGLRWWYKEDALNEYFSNLISSDGGPS